MKPKTHKYTSAGGHKPKLAGARHVYGDEHVCPGLITPHGTIYSGSRGHQMPKVRTRHARSKSSY